MGRTVLEACRRGKSIWCPTSGGGPDLGIHLGMSGRIVVDAHEGGDPQRGRARQELWYRFSLTFGDGGRLWLLDKRLLDQASIAGVGNLLADEVLWQSHLDPRRPSGSLSTEELRRRAVARHRGRAHDVLVPGEPGMTQT